MKKEKIIMSMLITLGITILFIGGITLTGNAIVGDSYTDKSETSCPGVLYHAWPDATSICSKDGFENSVCFDMETECQRIADNYCNPELCVQSIDFECEMKDFCIYSDPVTGSPERVYFEDKFAGYKRYCMVKCSPKPDLPPVGGS